jgi:HK97 family phage prohead protease
LGRGSIELSDKHQELSDRWTRLANIYERAAKRTREVRLCGSVGTFRSVRGSTVQRASVLSTGNQISGCAAVFHKQGEPGTEYRIAENVVERIGRDAFNRALKEKHDTAALLNHDPSEILGRVSSGTLNLEVDNVGLHYDVDLPDSPVGLNARAAIKRGDIHQSSFSFRVVKQEFTLGKGSEPDVRLIQDVDLFDVAPVTFPAYSQTSVG